MQEAGGQYLHATKRKLGSAHETLEFERHITPNGTGSQLESNGRKSCRQCRIRGFTVDACLLFVAPEYTNSRCEKNVSKRVHFDASGRAQKLQTHDDEIPENRIKLHRFVSNWSTKLFTCALPRDREHHAHRTQKTLMARHAIARHLIASRRKKK